MDYTTNKKLKTFVLGARIGITGSIISMLGREITGRSLGFSQMTLGSTAKVALTTGISTLGFLAGVDYIEEWKK